VYKIVIGKSAEKELNSLPNSVLLKVNAAILQLVNDPRPTGCKKLKGFKDLFRIRVGNYRVVYSIQDKILRIEVLKIADRKDVYK
jgi:mRNA interferase RelE/StbE